MMPRGDRAMAKVDRLVEQGELALIEARAVAPATDGALDRLNTGTLHGLELATDTVKGVQAALRRDGVEQIDPKLLRAGLDAGLSMARLSMRAAENEFQRRKSDAVEKLLEAIAAEKSKPATK